MNRPYTHTSTKPVGEGLDPPAKPYTTIEGRVKTLPYTRSYKERGLYFPPEMCYTKAEVFYMKYCDLHTHSIFSDGTYTPAQLIDAAVELGLSAIALTDHNTVDGLPDFLSAARGKPITAIAGAEFSVDYNGKELHLLGLYIPESQFSAVSLLMDIFMERKEQSNRDLIAALNKAGYDIDFDAIQAATPKGKFNRAHIAGELTKKGYTASIKEAFQTLLHPAAGFYKEPARFTLWEMLDFLKDIGAVPVLAHPFLNLKTPELEKLLPEAKKRGLVGMECYYSLNDEAANALALILACKYDLERSGGSDFHGDRKPDIFLGTGHGNLKVPGQWAEILQKSAR